MSGFLKDPLILSGPGHERGCSWACSIRSKGGYHFVLFNASDFDCSVIKLLAMANYQNYHFYFTIKYIYLKLLYYFFTVVFRW